MFLFTLKDNIYLYPLFIRLSIFLLYSHDALIWPYGPKCNFLVLFYHSGCSKQLFRLSIGIIVFFKFEICSVF